MKLTDLTPLPDNPRKITDAAIEKLKQSIQRDGKFMVARPIIVSSDGVILGGNQRHRACLELGMNDIPDEWVKRVDWTEEEARRFVVVDNAPAGMAGEFDLELLSGQYALEALIDMGFDAAEFGKEPGGGGGDGGGDNNDVTTLSDRFGVPPFSVLNAREGVWQDRKRAWIAMGIKSELGRGGGWGHTL